jgi:hypothetical protein
MRSFPETMDEVQCWYHTVTDARCRIEASRAAENGILWYAVYHREAYECNKFHPLSNLGIGRCIFDDITPYSR